MQSEEQLIIDEVDKELKRLIQQSMQPGGGSQAVRLSEQFLFDSPLNTSRRLTLGQGYRRSVASESRQADQVWGIAEYRGRSIKLQAVRQALSRSALASSRHNR